MRKFFSILGAAVLMGLLAGPINVEKAEAHGVGYRQSESKAVALDFFYSTGETMSYLETKVFSPEDEKIAYQSGRTDDQGRFAFMPNVPGTWRIVVKDDEGHQVNAEVSIDASFFEKGAEGQQSQGAQVHEKKAVPEGLDLYVRAGLGVSLLFNIAAFVLLAKRRKAA